MYDGDDGKRHGVLHGVIQGKLRTHRVQRHPPGVFAEVTY
jgi:hypothetical protein